MSLRREVVYFARHRQPTARIQMNVLVPRTLKLAQPLALLPVRPEDDL
jgi:hypothetical protein